MADEEGSRGRGFLGRVLRATAAIEDGILVLLLTAMIGLAVTQIVLRNLFSSGIVWGDSALRVGVLWVGLLGAVAATRYDKQITVDVLSRFLPSRLKGVVRVVTDLFTSAVCGLLAWHAGRLLLGDRAAGSVGFASVPLWVCELVVPGAFAIIAIRYLAFAWVHLRLAVGGETSR